MIEEDKNMIQKFNNYLKKLVDYRDKSSPAYRFRRKRMEIFEHRFAEWFDKVDGTITILDVGGTLNFWTVLDFKYLDRVHITLLNLDEKTVPPDMADRFQSVSGDATNMKEYADNSFDLVFSNSVIEHVGDFENQKKMIAEMKRISKHRYLQTPNRYFPIEPHYGFPLFQFFPMKLKIYMVMHYNMRYKRAENKEEAYRIASEIRLLNKTELRKLFPYEAIYRERIFGITKSFYVFF